jgi:hypothetical protein
VKNIDIGIIDITQQDMLIKCQNGFTKKYKISTAKNGIGNLQGSYQTPLGRHVVCDKIGNEAPMHTIFRGRQNTGEIFNNFNKYIEQDLILTRILRLKGLDPGINLGCNQVNQCIDSYDRFIYIHGTNREDLLGQPASLGCIRMGNADIKELFENIRVGAEIHISDQANLQLKI